MSANQNPEQIARDAIDAQLRSAGWTVQSKGAIDFHSGQGQAVREYVTDTGPADYVLFIDGHPVGVIEAKKETLGQNITTIEDQTADYATAKLKWVQSSGVPLPFLYEATGVLTRFTDQRDPKPRSREVFSFHRPETLRDALAAGRSLRARLHDLPALDPTGLRDCQIDAITHLEASLKQARPRALIQMATGSGKTFTAITSIYRLLKHARIGRVLFLVDTRNLGEQAEQEFLAFTPTDDNRKFTELYTVARLSSAHVPGDAQVCISTIQRMYSILQGRELDASAEDENPAERSDRRREPLPVAYSEKIPPEFFDLIIIDECHRSIYNLWRQVLDYFDAFLVGLTATPDARTYAFFRQNVVSEYPHEDAVADGVNVQGEVYVIETAVSQQGGVVLKGLVEKREKLTRAKRWSQQDEDETYSASKLDRDIVNPSQIRTVIRAFRDKLPEIFPDRIDAAGAFEVPKTLVFAKTDSHADDIINIVREEFGEGNAFCKKVTYKNEEDPKSVLAQFRNEYHPRIAVTVDMIATGTDVKPLECLLFMRDVKSKGYFEQMKGRGTRTLDHDALRKVSSAAKSGKTHYVIVDAIGVTKSLKTSSRPPITRPTVPFRDLAMEVVMGATDADTVSSLAGRLARIERQLTPLQKHTIAEKMGGVALGQVVKDLFHAIDGEAVEQKAREIAGVPKESNPGDTAREKAQQQLVTAARAPLTGAIVTAIVEACTANLQTLDHDTQDQLLNAGWDADGREQVADEIASHPNVELPTCWIWIRCSDAFDNVSTNGLKIPQAEYLTEGYFPVVDQGAPFIGGYTNDETKLVPVPPPLVVFGDHTRVVKLLRQRFAPGADGTKILWPLPFYLSELLALFLRFGLSRDSARGYARHFQYVHKMTIPLCSLPEQQEILRLLDEQFEEIERNDREIDVALRKSEALRQAILKKAFTGRLVPQDPADEPASELLARLRAAREKDVAPVPRTTKKKALFA